MFYKYEHTFLVQVIYVLKQKRLYRAENDNYSALGCLVVCLLYTIFNYSVLKTDDVLLRRCNL